MIDRIDISTVDPRIVSGFRCTWWDGIEKVKPMPNIVGSRGQRLPGCPYCHGPLYQFENAENWWSSVRKFEAEGHHGFVDFISWLKGRPCFSTIEEAKSVYEQKPGRKVVL